MLYLDASALVKLAVVESETEHLRSFLSGHRDAPRFSSMLAHAEVLRAVRPVGGGAIVAARDALSACYLVDVTREILERAGMLDVGTTLRTLDAIHLITASMAEERLTAVVIYDDRMAKAARAMGLAVVSPS